MRWLLLLFCFFPIRFLAAQKTDSVFLFSYFKDNGQDGLHLAYSEDGFHWKALNNDQGFLRPVLSKDSLMRDPCIIRGGDGLFHMVWTVSWKDRGIGHASSPDLIHWSAQQYIPVMQHEDSAKNCWAPEIFYDELQQQYMIYWATTIAGKFPETAGNGDHNHRMYYTTTKDFTTFTPTALLYDGGFNVIDATIQKIGAQYVMFLKDETLKPAPQKNLHIATSNNLYGGYGKSSPAITGNYWAEGPTAVYVKGQWLVYFDKYTQHKYGAVASADLANWRDVSNQVSIPDGLRHGTIFTVTKAEFEKLKVKKR